MAKLELKNGDRFGFLTYLKDAPKRTLPCGQTNRVALCICDCGNEVEVRLVHLTRLRTISCGCKVKTQDIGVYKGSPLYNTWRAMRYRCSQNYFQKQYYFEKGVTLFPDWNKFHLFKEWALANGYKDGLQIDRKKNNLGYYPDNCKFSTQEQNMANRDITFRVLFKGELVPFTDLCRKFKMNETDSGRTYSRIKRGWSAEMAFKTPARKGKYKRGSRKI